MNPAIEVLNRSLFLLLNAPAHADLFQLSIARFFAEDLIWAVPLLLLAGWLFGSVRTRKVLLVASLAILLALISNLAIGMIWPQPRPFVLGLGNRYLAHAPDPSFPSDHLTVLCAMAFSLLHYRGYRSAGVLLCVLAAPVAWARIYLGVHFPLDMLGAVAVAAVAAWLAAGWAFLYMPVLFACANRLYRLLFARLIAVGWLSA